MIWNTNTHLEFSNPFPPIKNLNQTTTKMFSGFVILSLILASYRMVWPGTANKCYSPRYDWAFSSRKEVVWMGMSCISQVQLPCGRLPGNGQVLPKIMSIVFKCILDIVIPYRWDNRNRAHHTRLFFRSTSNSLGWNSKLHTSLLSTSAWYWCTISDRFPTK